ncbi:hypothetical protein ACWFQ8_04530 [Streptomyces sp. NPDC055254]
MAVRCGSCGRESEWPQPEVGCGSCGTVVRLPVHPLERLAEPPPGASGTEAPGSRGAAGPAAGAPGARPSAAGTQGAGTPGAGTPGALASGPGAGSGTPGAGRPSGSAGPGGRAGSSAASGGRGTRRGPAHIPLPPTAPVPRPAFRPVTIRTARDAVATAALYLRWLGFQDVRQPDGRPIPSAAVDLRAPGLVAQVDPTTAPAGLRAVECVWLNGLTASATSVYFALAGYTQDARTRADDLGIPLFVMDLTGMPQPVNDPADQLIGFGA